MSPNEYQALVEFLGRPFAEVDQRFVAIDQRFVQIDQRFDALTTELREIRQDVLAHFGLQARVEALEARIGPVPSA
jgi:hypothetical protein